MIKSITAFTYEIDSPDEAVAELKEQIEEKLDLSKLEKGSALGIVVCSYDYIEAEVISLLAEQLPFEIVGETSLSQAVNGEAGVLFLSLLILYSDDCKFYVGTTEPLKEDAPLLPYIEESYGKIKSQMDGEAKLILAFPPILFHHSGDEFVNALSKVSDRAPIFGSISIDDSQTYEFSHTISLGNAYKDRLVYAVLEGNVKPEFRMASLSGAARLAYKGEITESQDNVLKGVNDIPLVNYLETIGLASGGKIREGVNSIPFLISFKDESGEDEVPVARAMFTILPDGSAVCGGNMPVGATLTVGVCEKDDVLKTTEEMINEINNSYEGRTVLIHSCIGRRLTLGAEPMLEIESSVKNISPDINFMLTYSGGEICPSSVTEGVVTNRFHNFTIVACIL